MVKYRGYLFSGSPTMFAGQEKFGFFALKEFDRYHVETRKDITKYVFRHGSKVGATSNGVRSFNLTFSAFASDEIERMKLIRLVSSIFNPPSIMSDTEGWHDLEFMTPDGTLRTTKAQVVDRPKIFDFNNQNWATFQVELVAKEGSSLMSKHQSTLKDRNTRLWVRLSNFLPHKHKYYRSLLEYHGTSDAPLNLKITAKKDLQLPWLTIRTINGDTLLTSMELGAISLTAWEQIVIDSYEETIEAIKNGEKTNLSNRLSLNSERPRLLSPVSNKGLIASVDCGISEAVLDLEWSWNEIWD